VKDSIAAVPYFVGQGAYAKSLFHIRVGARSSAPVNV
jgi:hypothetical protein